MGLGRVLICGGRHLNERAVIQALEGHNTILECGFPSLVIHGGASGADAGADEWAREMSIPVVKFRAEWELHGRAAGPARNSRMLVEGKPDLVIALWDGRSKGTLDMISRATAHGVRVEIIPAGDLR